MLEEKLKQYQPLVRKLASHTKAKLPACVECDDLVQVGMMGLMQALNSYQEMPGAKFETYASQRIKGAMLDELRRMDWVPRHERKNADFIRSTISLEDMTPDDRNYLERHYADYETPLTRLLEKEQVCRAVAAIAELPERQKKLVHMYYEQDITLKTIADDLGVSESRACQLLKNANARLNEIYISRNG